jgi:hypothetical protein
MLSPELKEQVDKLKPLLEFEWSDDQVAAIILLSSPWSSPKTVSELLDIDYEEVSKWKKQSAFSADLNRVASIVQIAYTVYIDQAVFRDAQRSASLGTSKHEAEAINSARDMFYRRHGLYKENRDDIAKIVQ